MFKKAAFILVASFLFFGMTPDLHAQGLVRLEMPAEDPGPPFYARVGLQILESDGWVAIPFYRAPECVPPTFNLLQFFDFPGPSGPGALACPLLMNGFILIEPDAPLGTFPRRVVFTAAGTPIWFVRSASFHAAAADGVLTMEELKSLKPWRGVTTRFHETLHPRDDDHKIIISADGQLEDGGSFTFRLTHIGDRFVRINIDLR